MDPKMSSDYLSKISFQVNVVTDEANWMTLE